MRMQIYYIPHTHTIVAYS